MRVYEMGESGQVILFPMSPSEIATETALLAASLSSRLNTNKKFAIV
jgi:hypothetical protein